MTADLCGGLPLEVWKSSVLLEHRRAHGVGERPLASHKCFARLLRTRGLGGLWTGCSARMLEGALSGAILLAVKEAILRAGLGTPVNPAFVALIAGAGGGASQALVMAPCSLLVTEATKSGDPVAVVARRVWKEGGVRGAYRGFGAVACRQATNWASRQGFSEVVRPLIRVRGPGGEVLAGCLAGALSAWNTPLEVARVEMQAQGGGHQRGATTRDGHSNSKRSASLLGTLRGIYKDRGLRGLFAGFGPRVCQACHQTIFLVSIPRLLDAAWKK